MGQASIVAIERATIPRPAGTALRPARFALAVPPDRTLALLGASLASGLAPLQVEFQPISTSRNDIGILVLPQRLLRGEPDLAFAAAYALVRDFALELAEPDLPTDMMPVPDPDREGPANESLDNFPPGCWVAAETLADDWAVTMIGAQAAWAYSLQQGRSSEGAGIVVAQPDTGIATHDEISGMIRNAGYNLVEQGQFGNPLDPMDYSGNPGHGTSTASALGSPLAGRVIGAAPRIDHMPIRCIENVARLSQVAVAQAIDLAVDRGAHVITMSLGGIPSFSLHRALRRAVAADVIVLAAAGNCVREVVFPARYSDCIAVGGVDQAMAMWPGSCRGPDVDISAPAQNVLVAKFDRPTGQPIVAQGQGTSFAAALTAGVAALWLAHHGRNTLVAAARVRGETLQAMFRRLVRASAKRPPNWDHARLGAGVVDARQLLACDLDTDRGRESVADLPLTDEAASQIKRYVVAATGSVAAVQKALPWELYGPELVLALVTKAKGLAPASRLEGPLPIDRPPLSPELTAAIATNPALAAALPTASSATRQ